MNSFWREQPLNSNEQVLFALLMEAHARCVQRNNASSGAVLNASVNSGDYIKSLVSGLCALGGVHAPIEQAHEFLAKAVFNPDAAVTDYLSTHKRVPGWGNAFYKDGPDPEFAIVGAHIAKHFDLLMDTVSRVTKLLHSKKIMIWPNPACYTAATALALRIPGKLAPWLFVKARLDGWASVFCASL